MDTSALGPRLMRTFLEEAEEHVRALNRDLLAIERDESAEDRAARLTTLLRTFHTLKGAARTVNVGVVADACHHLEDIIASVRAAERALDPELRALLFAAADGIEDVRRRLDAGTTLEGSSLDAFVPQLADAAANRSAAPQKPQPSPPPPTSTRTTAPSPTSTRTAAPPPSSARTTAPAPSATRATAPSPPKRSNVRVGAERLDALLAGTGELLVAWHRVEARHADVAAIRETVTQSKTEWRSAENVLAKLLGDQSGVLARRGALVLNRTGETLRRLERDLERLTNSVSADARLLGEAATRVDDDVRRVRMLPFADACAGLERAVRDAAQAEGKDVELVIEGGDVELDRSVLEGSRDALLHLVRNAASHGIELPAERRAAGKPPRARVTVSAALRGARVEIAVADDGRGIDLAAVRAQARKAGLPEPDDAAELTRLIFESGLSTAPMITDVAGRGVGLDVAKSRIESLHGTIDVAFVPGTGTRFTMTVPLTLTTMRVVMVADRGQTFAISAVHVEALARVRRSDLQVVQGREMLGFGGGLVTVASLGDTLGFCCARDDGGEALVPALIVAAHEKRVAFLVEEMVATQEVVVKSLGPRLRGLRSVSGATLLPSGRIALVLNAAHLVRSALGRTPSRIASTARKAASAAAKRVLVVDDSLTTRSLEKSILEAAGYETLVAADGETAWRLLREHGADLVVSDVEMPRMDGFTLTETVRASERFRHLPVVLVTGRENAADRTRGMQAGADAYLVKSGFDQTTLLETIAHLL